MTVPLRVLIPALLVPAGVLVIDPGGLSPFGPAKWLAVSVLATAAVATSAWQRSLALGDRLCAAWAVLIGLLLAATALGLDGLYAWTGTPERNFGFFTWVLCGLLFVVGRSIVDGGDARFIAGVAAATGAGLGVWAVAEAFGWQPVRLDVSTERLQGPLGSPAMLGAAAALLLPITVGFACDRTLAPWRRRAAGVGAAMCGVALIGSGSRAAWVGAAAAAVVAAWSRRQWIAAHRRVAVSAAATAMAVVVVTGVGLGMESRLDVFDASDPGGAGRLDEWRVAVRVIAEDPLTGAGPEGYRIAFPSAVDAGYERQHGRAEVPDRAHNSLLDVGAAGGLPALVALGVLLALVGRRVVPAIGNCPAWLAGLATGLVAYSLQAMFLFPLAVIDPAAWLLAGVVVAQVAKNDGEDAQRRLPRMLAVAMVPIVGVVLVAGGRDVVGDRRARGALRSLDEGEVSTAQRRARQAVQMRPDVVRYRLAAARTEEESGRLEGIDGALDELRGALRISPRDPFLRSERGRLLVERARRSGRAEDAAAAVGYLGELVRDDPVNAEVHLRLGVAAAAAGDFERAERAWWRADDLAPRNAAPPVNLAAEYARRGAWSQAKAAAERALARDPAHPRARAILEQARAHGT